jgi:uncharacterized damage-inducible protein DinB
MIDVRIVRELYRYNTWANGRVFAAASSLAPEELTSDQNDDREGHAG